MLKQESSRLALVTGASSGIGAVTSLRLAEEGFHVILTARRTDLLKDVARQIASKGRQADFIAADLSQVDERFRLFHQVNDKFGCPDILVNNAGLGWYGYFHQMSWQTAEQMLAVNLNSGLHLSRLFLPEMIKRGRGQVVFVGSIAGQIPSQGVALYSATKGFLDSFTTALHRELKGSGVSISLVRPGSVRTEFYQAAVTLPMGRHLPTEGRGVAPERVADAIVSLVKRPRRVVYVPAVLMFTPWVEMIFGWVMDLIGPLLLRKEMKDRQS